MRMLNAKALAKRLSVSERTIRRWHQEGRLPKAVRFGRTVRWRASEIDDWLTDNTEGDATPGRAEVAEAAVPLAAPRRGRSALRRRRTGGARRSVSQKPTGR